MMLKDKSTEIRWDCSVKFYCQKAHFYDLLFSQTSHVLI